MTANVYKMAENVYPVNTNVTIEVKGPLSVIKILLRGSLNNKF